MTRLILIAILTLAVSCVSSGQTKPANEPPQLVESRELTERVVKLYNEHKFNEALPLAKRALELAESVLGKNDSRLISLLVNIGALYVGPQNDEARPYFERALAIAETNFGQDDVRVTRPLDELGYLMLYKGDLDRAASHFARSLALKEKYLPPNDIEIARTARVLGDTYARNRENEKAERAYQLAVRLYDQRGTKGSELVEVLKRYLAVLTAEHQNDEAAAIQNRLAGLSAQPDVVESGVVNGRAVRLVQPAYPRLATRSYGIRIVRVRVVIDETGKVISAKAEPSPGPDMSYPDFAGAAEDAARKSVFTPTIIAGSPAKITGVIIYRFVSR